MDATTLARMDEDALDAADRAALRLREEIASEGRYTPETFLGACPGAYWTISDMNLYTEEFDGTKVVPLKWVLPFHGRLAVRLYPCQDPSFFTRIYGFTLDEFRTLVEEDRLVPLVAAFREFEGWDFEDPDAMLDLLEAVPFTLESHALAFDGTMERWWDAEGARRGLEAGRDVAVEAFGTRDGSNWDHVREDLVAHLRATPLDDVLEQPCPPSWPAHDRVTIERLAKIVREYLHSGRALGGFGYPALAEACAAAAGSAVSPQRAAVGVGVAQGLHAPPPAPALVRSVEELVDHHRLLEEVGVAPGGLGPVRSEPFSTDFALTLLDLSGFREPPRPPAVVPTSTSGGVAFNERMDFDSYRALLRTLPEAARKVEDARRAGIRRGSFQDAVEDVLASEGQDARRLREAVQAADKAYDRTKDFTVMAGTGGACILTNDPTPLAGALGYALKKAGAYGGFLGELRRNPLFERAYTRLSDAALAKALAGAVETLARKPWARAYFAVKGPSSGPRREAVRDFWTWRRVSR